MTGLYKQQRSNYWDNKSEKESAEKILQEHKAHSGAEDAAALDPWVQYLFNLNCTRAKF